MTVQHGNHVWFWINRKWALKSTYISFTSHVRLPFKYFQILVYVNFPTYYIKFSLGVSYLFLHVKGDSLRCTVRL
jgi:hypothetical protein